MCCNNKKKKARSLKKIISVGYVFNYQHRLRGKDHVKSKWILIFINKGEKLKLFQALYPSNHRTGSFFFSEKSDHFTITFTKLSSMKNTILYPIGKLWVNSKNKKNKYMQIKKNHFFWTVKGKVSGATPSQFFLWA